MSIGRLVSLILLVFGSLIIFKPSDVRALCNDNSSYGALNFTLPIVPSDSNQADLWVRVQAKVSSVKLLAEVNSESCLELNSNVDPDKWNWIASPTNKSINLDKDLNELKIVGIQDGVKVDKVLLITDGCIPFGDGSNCTSKNNYIDDSGVKFKEIPSPVGTVSGRVNLSATPIEKRDSLSNLSYLVSGRQVMSSNKPIMFDTTLLENGSHRIYIISDLKNGETIREVVSVSIKNPEGPFSPLSRFMKLNRNILLISAIAISLVLTILLAIVIIKSKQKAKAIRKLKGFDI